MGACQQFDADPSELGESELRWGLVNEVAPLALPQEVRRSVPSMGRAFLEQLQAEGRISGGNELGRYVGALGEALEQASPTRPVVNATSKLSRNDPCPCGSGRKYKKCCMRLLDD